jgi:hypothetical protein
MPFVAAIWAYEQLAISRKYDSGLSMSGPEIQTSSKRPFRALFQPARSSVPQTATESNGRTSGSTHAINRPQTGDATYEDEPQLKSLVLKLTARVEELTNMVSQLQEVREASVVA